MPEYIYYKIVSKDENIKDCYVGKTTNFKRRVRNHRNLCYNENSKCYNLKVYEFIRENGGWNNFNMIEIEKGQYDNEESAIKERYWIEELNATLNIKTPSKTQKECRKEYRENNKEYFKEYQIEYYKNNKEYFKEYYENNKEYQKQREKQKEKIICECGCEIIKRNLLRHLKSKKHINLMS
jgi:hypothetical protein